MNLKSMSFGELLKKLRKEKKLTLNRLAELADLSPSYLSRIERGKRNVPNARVLKKLAPHLGLTPQEIMVAAGYINSYPEKVLPAGYGEGTARNWQEIVRDPALEAALEEIGYLTSDEKEGLLLYLKAIKLRREMQK